MTGISIVPKIHKGEETVGKFRADYSKLTPEKIAQEDKELTELYANSHACPQES